MCMHGLPQFDHQPSRQETSVSSKIHTLLVMHLITPENNSITTSYLGNEQVNSQCFTPNSQLHRSHSLGQNISAPPTPLINSSATSPNFLYNFLYNEYGIHTCPAIRQHVIDLCSIDVALHMQWLEDLQSLSTSENNTSRCDIKVSCLPSTK